MEAQIKLYNIIFSFAQPMSLKAAVLLNIPDIISSSGAFLSVPEIAFCISSATGKSPNSEYLARILRFLASHDVFAENISTGADGVKIYKYGSTAVSELLVRKENHSKSSAALLLMETSRIFMDPWQHIYDSVMEGCPPFNRAHGMNVWEYADVHPEGNMLINDAMASNSGFVVDLVLENYEGFKEIKSVVDVGGAAGSAVGKIVEKYSHIHGINFDLPHVIATAPKHMPGVEHVGGDMFENIPSADAVFLKWVLHDWDDEECIRLLKNCYLALPNKGKVIIVEAVVEDEGFLRSLGLALDLFMMAHTRAGKERTEEEYKFISHAAGFKCYSIIKLPFVQAIIVLTKS